MDCFSTPNLLTVEQAQQLLLDATAVVSQTQTVSLADADKRVLSQDIISPINVPQHDNSAMDGYALCDDAHLDTLGATAPLVDFTMVGTAYAGSPFSQVLQHGQCIRIMTGAVIPAGTTAVIMQESTQIQTPDAAQTDTIDAQTSVLPVITLNQPVKAHANIRRQGEDIAQGEQVFAKGHRLNAVDIGLLASLGCAEVQVYRALKVAILATGDELTVPGQPLAPGHIYETNSVVIAQMLTRLGAEVLSLGIIRDDKDAIKQAFIKADAFADVVISSGGVSVGEADYTKAVLDEMGQTAFWKVAMKPGKPFAFGRLPSSCFMGLPGNPVSAVVTFHQLVVPALYQIAGSTAPTPTQLTATTTQPIKKRAGRTDFQRGFWSVSSAGHIQVTPLTGQGSGMLSSMSRANCFIVLDKEAGNIEQGANVSITVFDDLLS